MKLSDVINSIPTEDTVTIVNYISGDIYNDCEAVQNILNSKQYHQALKSCRVYKLEVGKCYGDLIISILEDEE